MRRKEIDLGSFEEYRKQMVLNAPDELKDAVTDWPAWPCFRSFGNYSFTT